MEGSSWFDIKDSTSKLVDEGHIKSIFYEIPYKVLATDYIDDCKVEILAFRSTV
jgi:hypothetical protein